MIEHELLFLGLLKDGPKHGYDIKKLIDEELFPFVGLKIKSIYYPLKKMEKLGLVSKDVGREGKFPEKYVYSLTSKGEKIFDHLVTESFSSIERPYFNIDLSLYFLEYVDKAIAQRQLRARMMLLKRIKRDLSELKQKTNLAKKHHHIILEHDIYLVEAEISSISKLIQVLE
ncbi:MAG: PadR family transcriptional regulator [Candidatus Omnitrophica bacterium]|nr:PadR family transcriptional regulator [Candidatus Omnitrophota bacterium]